jgi:hypothetical protein
VGTSGDEALPLLIGPNAGKPTGQIPTISAARRGASTIAEREFADGGLLAFVDDALPLLIGPHARHACLQIATVIAPRRPSPVNRKLLRAVRSHVCRCHLRTITLSAQASSVPAAANWTPCQLVFAD